jgi:hypothetical protein
MEYGAKWRLDSKFKCFDGMLGTTLKARTGPYCLPIYAYMEFLIQKKGMSEDEALLSGDDIFRSNCCTNASKPNLASCKKVFAKMWGKKVDLKRGVLVIHPPFSPSI